MNSVVQKPVLIVEDNCGLSNLYKIIIEESGCPAITVESGADALTLLASIAAPALILLDFSMPEMSGETFLKLLKRNLPEIFRTVPIVGLSGYEPDAPGLTVFRSLVSECLVKSDDLGPLVRVVNKFTQGLSS